MRAAPYVHPKLKAVDHGGSIGGGGKQLRHIVGVPSALTSETRAESALEAYQRPKAGTAQGIARPNLPAA